MAATPKPVRKAIKGLVKEGHNRAKAHADIASYSKSTEKSRDKKQVVRLKEAYKKGSPVSNKGKHVKSLVNPKIVKANKEKIESFKKMK